VEDSHINEDSAASLATTFDAKGNGSIMMDQRQFETIEEGSVRDRVKSANQTLMQRTFVNRNNPPVVQQNKDLAPLTNYKFLSQMTINSTN
jgi:hypothetical protein